MKMLSTRSGLAFVGVAAATLAFGLIGRAQQRNGGAPAIHSKAKLAAEVASVL